VVVTLGRLGQQQLVQLGRQQLLVQRVQRVAQLEVGSEQRVQQVPLLRQRHRLLQDVHQLERWSQLQHRLK
jgi:hypothetical protein